MPGATLAILKLNPAREVTWRYQGKVIGSGPAHIVVEAIFDRENTWVDGMYLARGDRFIETYYSDRWYNVFEIRAQDDDHLRGWYCNIGCPAVWDQKSLSYIDLALDLLVFPDGRQVILDEDEFLALDIPADWQAKARLALAELQARYPIQPVR